jgi:thiosulfate/3-mercaptopyruvate sulfurtransferase
MSEFTKLKLSATTSNPRIHQIAALLTVVIVAALAGLGCGETVKVEDPRPAWQKQKQPMPLNSEVFIDAQRFQQLDEQADATVIDARTLSEYESGHIPGAIHSGNKTSGYKPFKNPANNDVLYRDVTRLQEKARSLGITRQRPVVIYGNPTSKRVGRLYWTLEYLGHGEVYAYPAGYESLKTELDFEPASQSPDDIAGDFVVSRRPSVLATNADVRAVAGGDQDAILVDTRRESEYTGEEDRGDPRQGYIPRATHYHWEQMFNEDDQLRSLETLEQEFRDLGLFEPNTLIIPYCQTGTRSAYMYAVLRQLDAYEATPKNYDGSWVKWSRHNDYPVADSDNTNQ